MSLSQPPKPPGVTVRPSSLFQGALSTSFVSRAATSCGNATSIVRKPPCPPPRITCACEIAEVIERLEDGRITLIARGTRPFRIGARQEELPYPAGTVEFLEDRPEDPDAEAASAAHEAYAELVNEATDRTPDMDEIGAMSAYQ